MSDTDAGEVSQPASLPALLARAGVTSASVIRVTGPGALPALLWLCRHGYDQVGYVRSGPGGPHEEEPDALLVAHTLGDLELKLLLPMTRQLRPSGVLIFRHRVGPGSSAVALEWLLKQHGLVLETRLAYAARELVVARRAESALRRAA
jgi:hypothetical protein